MQDFIITYIAYPLFLHLDLIAAQPIYGLYTVLYLAAVGLLSLFMMRCASRAEARRIRALVLEDEAKAKAKDEAIQAKWRARADEQLASGSLIILGEDSSEIDVAYDVFVDQQGFDNIVLQDESVIKITGYFDGFRVATPVVGHIDDLCETYGFIERNPKFKPVKESKTKFLYKGNYYDDVQDVVMAAWLTNDIKDLNPEIPFN